jgi:hypothetical protein
MVNEFFQGEHASFLPGPAVVFTVTQISSGKVDPYATVRVDKNRYSVPSRYVGFKVQVQMDIDRIHHFHAAKGWHPSGTDKTLAKVHGGGLPPGYYQPLCHR